MMVPYRPDRPANPATAPESALAEYGVFEDIGTLESGNEIPRESSGDDRSGDPGGHLHQTFADRSEPTQGDSRDPERTLSRSPRPREDAYHDRSAAPTPQIQNIHIIERIQERVTGPEHPLASPSRSERDMSSSIPSLEVHVETASVLPSAGTHTDASHTMKGSMPPMLESVSADHAKAKASADLAAHAQPRSPSTDVPEPLMPMSTQPAAGMQLPPEEPSPPPRSHLRPRQRSAIAEEIHLSVLAESATSPVVHIGSITVEVIEIAKRPEPRRVVQQAPRHGGQSTSSKTGSSNHRVSRPLRTFGLRQL